KPLAADERDPTFEFGMAASLINRLSAIRGLVVRPASAIVKYTSVEQDLFAAGQEQNVNYVLASSYRKLGDRIVLTAQLIHVQNRSVLWSDVCEEQCDAFALHDALAEKTTRSLLLRLKDDEQRALTRHGTENKAAYALYNLGLYNWYQNKLDIERMQKSVHYFEQAIAKDPDYAMAYAWLGTIYAGLGLGAGAKRKEYQQKAEELASRALELDDTVTQAHLTLGVSAYRYHWDWAKAERYFKRAWELSPNDVEVNRAYSAYLASIGRLDESIFLHQLACDLQPLSFDLSAMLAMRLYLARRYDEAIEQARTALQMGLTGEVPYVAWRSYEEKGMYEEAFTALQELCESEKAKDLSALVARTYSVSGYKKAREVYLTNRLIAIKNLAEKGILASIEVAIIYALLNNRDEAFKWLEKAYESHSDRLVYLKINPDFDSLRSDPRFADIVRRIGIP
ncbi:MAG TPA: hypothetical protein VLD57_05155, partial [Blastocatellia bacterium]|nr:hypothetical protein [Blastocatellia bacterium]